MMLFTCRSIHAESTIPAILEPMTAGYEAMAKPKSRWRQSIGFRAIDFTLDKEVGGTWGGGRAVGDFEDGAL